MRIAHLNFSTQGGAGFVAQTLDSSMRGAGVESRLFHVLEDNLWSSPFADPISTLLAAADKYVLSKNSTKQQVSIFRSRHTAQVIESVKGFDPDVLHLHWIEGFLSDKTLLSLGRGRKIIWTLHDMRPFTGGCHHSGDCNLYQKTCTPCPILQMGRRSLATSVLDSRRALLDKLSVKFVAPSHHMKRLACQSALLEEKKVHEIPNPIAPGFFTNQRLDESSRSGAIFIANNLWDPNKGLKELIDWKVRSGSPIPISVVGRGNSASLSGVGVTSYGQLRGMALIEALDRSKYLIVNSQAETAPLVVAEAAARGVIPLVKAALRETIHPALASAGVGFFELEANLSQLINVIDQESSGVRLQSIAAASRLTHSPETVAKKYLDLYENS